MNYNDIYIMELAKASIFNTAPQKPKEDIDWKYIFDKAKEQNISGLLFNAINMLDKEYLPQGELMLKWHKLLIATIGTTSRMYNEFMSMNDIMQKEGIKFIGLKGCILRKIYPVPELRTMGDFDILTPPETLDRVIALFKNKGYEVYNDPFGIVCEKGALNWEIFTTMEEEFRYSVNKIDNIFFNNTICEENALFPNYTYFLLHLIVHTGKHCIREGAGIRNLCDIALFINKYKDEIDFDNVRELCKEQGFEKIYDYIINTAGKWFGTDIEGIYTKNKNCDKFVEYALLNGVFGKQDNSIVPQVAKHEDDNIGVVRKILFPSLKMLDYRYKYLQKYPFLLPVAWVHRIFSAVFKWKYSFSQMAGDMKEAVEFSKERNKWLKELGLKEKH